MDDERLPQAKADYDAAKSACEATFAELVSARAEMKTAEAAYLAAATRRMEVGEAERQATLAFRAATQTLGRCLARRLDAQQADAMGTVVVHTRTAIREGLK